MPAKIPEVQTILVDAHVHLYPCFDINQFLTCALLNFVLFAQEDQFLPILLLTESQEQHFFQKFKAYANADYPVKDWHFYPTGESVSLTARNHQQTLYLIAGRQIVTAEKLEVLALITDNEFPDGLPLADTVEAIADKGGIPVIPWGFGKWTGQRKKVLHRFLQTHQSPVFLGDNSGRPRGCCPPYFKGRRILPGTDPLPLASQVSRPGSFGFTIQGTLNPEEPGKQLKQLLLDPHVELHPYGSLESPVQFIRNQLALRFSNQAKLTNC